MKIQQNEQGESQLINFLKPILTKDTIFFCIGSDMSIGDCFGPLVGQFLNENNITHIGNLHDTANATNISQKLENIPRSKRKNIIAIDAAMSKETNDLNQLRLLHSPVYPGQAVCKSLPPIGDHSICFFATTDIYSNSNRLRHSYFAAKFVSNIIITLMKEIQ